MRRFLIRSILCVAVGTVTRFSWDHRAFLIENQALIAIGLILLIAMAMALHRAWHAGYETACRAFASHTLNETRRQTSTRQ